MKSNYIKSFLTSMLFLLLAYTVAGQSDLKDSNYATVIKNYLTGSNKMAKFSNADLEDLYVNKEIFSEKTKVANVYLNQRFKGIKIFNAISSVAIKDNTVFHFADRFKENIGEKVNAVSESLSARDAIRKVAQYFNLGSFSGLELIEKGNNKLKFSKGTISQEDIDVEKVYFEDKDGSLKLAWNLNIYTLDGSHWWSVRVDALTGKILNVNDWVVSCTFGDVPHNTHSHNKNFEKKSFNLFESNSIMLVDGSQYNVFALPTESPNHGARQLVTEPANPNASPYGWHDINGIAGAEFTDTRGNNVLAQDDADNNNSGGSRPSGGSALNFDFSLDLNEQPDVSIDASITNLFYMNNMIHDIFYEYGFDEASGNFQQKNYSGAPGQSDPVAADGLDGGGLNNANFSTPPDGARPRMQMYLWNSRPSTIPLLEINNGTLAGPYTAVLPSNSDGDSGVGNITRPDENPITANLVIVDDGTSMGEEGCNALTNAINVNGNIALIRRGSCNFTVKIQNAQDAGAVAVIVANHNNPTNDPNYVDYVSMYGVTDPAFTIPSIFINFADGDALMTAIGNGEVISATIINDPPILIDGNYDNGVIGHEYGHGISTRLTGGSDNSDCLFSCTEYDTEGNCIGTYTEQMGEGWSDWVALVTTMKSSDIGSDGRGIGTFDVNEDIDGAGIRVNQYSTNTAINPTTYSDTNNTSVYSAPHGVGEIWAAMLWDLTWAYIDKYGFDADLFNGTGGNNKIMQIVLDGMKLQPCNPGFVDGRDAILAADLAITGGEDQCMIWDVFAARGLGVNATQGSSLVRTDQIQNFETPDPNDPSLANCSTLSSETFNSNDFRIYPNPTSDKFTIKSTRSLGDVTLELIDINGRKIMSKKATLIGEVELNLKSLSPGLYILKIKGEFINASEKIIKK